MRVRGSQKNAPWFWLLQENKVSDYVESHKKSPKTGRVTYLLSKSMPAIYIMYTKEVLYKILI